MTIEIENATFAELKANRTYWIDQATAVETNELARRYVQARTDAKQRDERMAEMGKEITALQTVLADEQQDVNRLTADNEKLNKQLDILKIELNKTGDYAKQLLAQTKEQTQLIDLLRKTLKDAEAQKRQDDAKIGQLEALITFQNVSESVPKSSVELAS